MAVYKGFVMVYAVGAGRNAKAAGACNTHRPLTSTRIAPCVATTDSTQNTTRRNPEVIGSAPFCVSGETVTVTSITQLLSQLLAATGKPRQAKRAALKRLLGRAK